ncbi:MAG: FAD-dependent oxidoreductase [Gammaproteobacteria bacterium]|nr:MAG: FAD-dependent oxidoreductase [Gammaproteobacteria bacterium]UCH40254.1 MAG: FAD-dependent oxidoreductase [Gammaproteobacteria bacterium]
MELRNANIERLDNENLDVLIVGSGINGAVSAAALAARGVKVGLIDARDFAGFTSQQSSNLVWGGIKYMEGYEFDLVAGLCKSRNELLDSFPSTVKEIRFLLTINRKFRFHPLVILMSTWLYWLLGRGRTRTPQLLSLKKIKKLEPLVNTYVSTAGVEYSDAFLHDNDARFVFNFVRSAMDKGCIAANYVASRSSIRAADGYWLTEAEDQISGRRFGIRSKVLINAAGAYVDQLNRISGIETEHHHLFSKGIHLLVPRISQSHRVLAFFADDERLFFAIPMANRTCIGTTDTRVDDPLTQVTDEDREFVLSNINARLDLPAPLTRDDVIAERCGVRPLASRKTDASVDVQHLSRRHVIEMDADSRHISIFGGKLTDCINVGDEISDCVSRLGLRIRQPEGKWYGEPGRREREAYFGRAQTLGLDQIAARDTGEILSERLWRRYGANANGMLDAIEKDPGLCEPLIENTGIRRCEIDYLAKHEMIVKLEDYLRRRSKIELLVSRDTLRQSAGLFEACEKLFGADGKKRFDEYFDEQQN